jgi:hypothetical protein
MGYALKYLLWVCGIEPASAAGEAAAWAARGEGERRAARPAGAGEATEALEALWAACAWWWWAAAFQPLFAELVVYGAFLAVAEDFEGFGYLYGISGS